MSLKDFFVKHDSSLAASSIIGGTGIVGGTYYISTDGSAQMSTEMNGVEATTSSYNGASSTGAEQATTVVGIVGVVSSVYGSINDGPDVIGVIFTKNDLPSDVVEKRAKKVYDSLDKDHIPTIDGGATLIAESLEARELLEQIFTDRTTQDVLDGLTVMESVYKKIPKGR